jgi:phage host-nuclease inhibitor protein Gam
MLISEGGKTREEKKSTGQVAWRITEPRDFRWTTVNTAIRYVLEKRNKTTDPVIRENADRTIKALLRTQ